MPLHAAGKLQFGGGGISSGLLSALASLNQDAVAAVVHAVAYAGGTEHAAVDHLLHLVLVLRVHGSTAEFELVRQAALVLHHESTVSQALTKMDYGSNYMSPIVISMVRLALAASPCRTRRDSLSWSIQFSGKLLRVPIMLTNQILGFRGEISIGS